MPLGDIHRRAAQAAHCTVSVTRSPDWGGFVAASALGACDEGLLAHVRRDDAGIDRIHADQIALASELQRRRRRGNLYPTKSRPDRKIDPSLMMAIGRAMIDDADVIINGRKASSPIRSSDNFCPERISARSQRSSCCLPPARPSGDPHRQAICPEIYREAEQWGAKPFWRVSGRSPVC